MKVKMNYGRYVTVTDVAEFARSDLQETEPNDNGVYEDVVTIYIPVPAPWLILISVARGRDGYHYSIAYENATGHTGYAPSARWNTVVSKHEAVCSAIDDLMTKRELECCHEALRKAKQELFASMNRQLTLF
ncbi:MAG: hypothetical protein K2G49_00440 [Muribaculum sp.]|nr:hypothetical protein [Muribaculum sp.]